MANILKDISNNILYNFLDLYCIKEDNYYILNKYIFKQYEYNNCIINFLNILKNYYNKKNLHYLNREINYNNLITVIRQICKKNKIIYFKKIKYDKSNYTIVYYFQIVQ